MLQKAQSCKTISATWRGSATSTGHLVPTSALRPIHGSCIAHTILHYHPSPSQHLTYQQSPHRFIPILSSITSPTYSSLASSSHILYFLSAMALAMNVRTNVGSAVAAPVDASVSSLKQATSVRFLNGAVAFKRASLVVRAEGKTEPGPGGRGNAPTTPTSPPGLSGTEIPLGVITTSAPLEQGSDKPVGERIAYVCQDCGYVYDKETPFEDVSDDYNCPQCKAPKARFTMANASVEEMLDTTKEDDAVSRGSGELSGSPPSQS